MGIDLKTVVFELVNFLVLLWLLRRFLFTPVRELIARRREEIERGATEVKTRRAEAEALRARYEGMVEISLPKEAFEKAPGLASVYPKRDAAGRILMKVPLAGTLFDLTLNQAEEVYEKGAR